MVRSGLPSGTGTASLVHWESQPWDGGTGGLGYTDWDAQPSDWQPGDYEVQIFVGVQWKVANTFTVEGEAPTPVSSPSATTTPSPTGTPSSTATPSQTLTPLVSPTNTTPATPNLDPLADGDPGDAHRDLDAVPDGDAGHVNPHDHTPPDVYATSTPTPKFFELT